MSAPTCPRDSAELRRTRYHDIDLHVCDACQGICVEQRRMIPLMQAVTADLRDSIDLDQELQPVEDTEDAATCPACNKPMENFGYMGMRLVFLDRCSRCALLWIDPEELGGMAVLYARTDRRVGALKAKYKAQQEELTRRTDRRLLARAAERMIGRLM